MEVTSTEIQNNFGTYLRLARVEDVYITRNNKRIAMLSYCDNLADSLSRAAESKAAYPENKTNMALDDFLKLSATSESRYEFIEGEVFQLASPTFEHQRIVVEIVQQMNQWSMGKRCKPVTAPFDVILQTEETRNIVQPDIAVICDLDQVDGQGKYSGIPTLLVEVLSESTRNKDMVKKLNVYMSGGVKEYWIVNPWNREVYIYTFDAGGIQNYRVFKGTENAGSEVLEGMSVQLGVIFS